jgi:hypothetical protein
MSPGSTGEPRVDPTCDRCSRIATGISPLRLRSLEELLAVLRWEPEVDVRGTLSSSHEHHRKLQGAQACGAN